jgi:hypothetical protein
MVPILLPLCRRAVVVSPDRVFPVVGDFCLTADMSLVDFNSKPRPFGNIYIAVLIGEYGRI